MYLQEPGNLKACDAAIVCITVKQLVLFLLNVPLLFSGRKSDDWPQELREKQIKENTAKSPDEIEIKIIGKEMASDTSPGGSFGILDVKTMNETVTLSYNTLGKINY